MSFQTLEDFCGRASISVGGSIDVVSLFISSTCNTTHYEFESCVWSVELNLKDGWFDTRLRKGQPGIFYCGSTAKNGNGFSICACEFGYVFQECGEAIRGHPNACFVQSIN